MKKTIVGMLAAFLMVALAGCGDEKAAEVKESAAESTSEVDSGDEVVAADAEEQATAAVGDTVTVGGWDVTITDIDTNANKLLADPDFYNEEPDGRYVLLTFEATYNGSERTADWQIDLSWSLTGSDQQIHDPDYQTTPLSNEPYEARKGGTVKGDVVFDVPAKVIEGGLVTVEAWDDNMDTIFADFAIG